MPRYIEITDADGYVTEYKLVGQDYMGLERFDEGFSVYLDGHLIEPSDRLLEHLSWALDEQIRRTGRDTLDER